MICFNGHKSPALWRSSEWQFFLDDLAPRLRPGGRIHLCFNRENGGNYYDAELRRFFEARGADLDDGSVTIWPGKRGRTQLLNRSERADSTIPSGPARLHPLLTKTNSATAGGSKR